MIVRGKVSRRSNARGIRVVPRIFRPFSGTDFLFLRHRQINFPKTAGLDTRTHLKRTGIVKGGTVWK